MNTDTTAHHAQLYGWVTTGNRRTEIYKGHDGHGGFTWFSRTRYHGDPLGEGVGGGHRIACECVTGFDSDPDFCFAHARNIEP